MLAELGLTDQDIARRITEWVVDRTAAPQVALRLATEGEQPPAANG